MPRKINNTVIINRAVPGSGKTTISVCIVEYMKRNGISIKVHSTDDYFMSNDGRYQFEIEKLYAFHLENFEGYTNSLKSNIPLIICDNINIAPWQTKPYTDAAREQGYQIIFLNFAPRKLEMHIESQKVTAEKPDAHGVPESVLVRFIDEYKSYSPLLDKESVIDPAIHKNYFWDSKKHVRKESSEPCAYFDADKVIEIQPDQYHKIKKIIGVMIYDLVFLDEEHSL